METPTPPSQIPPQNFPPQNFQPPNAAPPRKSKLGLFAALGCGLPILGLLALLGLGSLLGDDDTASNKAGSTPGAKAASSGDEEALTKAALPRYIGKWQGADGTSLWIRGDGKGDFDGGNTKVSGGGVTINEGAKKLAISSFFGIGKTWTLDAPPKAKNGQTEMTLNGVVYRRSGGFDASASGSGSTPGAGFDEDAPPSMQEQNRLVRETLTAFDKAIATNDFSKFYFSISQAWQKQTSAEELRSTFKSFIDKKMRMAPVLNNLKPAMQPAKIEDGFLVLRGTYPTTPNKTHFKLRYLPENEAWKLGEISVKVGDPIKE